MSLGVGPCSTLVDLRDHLLLVLGVGLMGKRLELVALRSTTSKPRRVVPVSYLRPRCSRLVLTAPI